MKTPIPFVAALTVLLLTGGPAQAEVTDIQWDASGRFDTKALVAPGKFAEICGKLAKGQSVGWVFKAEAPMNFNIHYHEGKKVEFPAKVDGAISAEGQLTVAVDQDYCWMWSNKTDKTAALNLTLQK